MDSATHITDPIGAAPVRDEPEPPLRAGWLGRLIAGAWAVGCLVVLTIAAVLPPSPTGMGTHTALGLQPCGFLVQTGTPCMSCGMTTAFAYMAHLQPVAAFAAQPMGALLYLAAVAAVVFCGITALTGRTWPALYILFYSQSFWFAVILVWIGSWAYKILAVRMTAGP